MSRKIVSVLLMMTIGLTMLAGYASAQETSAESLNEESIGVSQDAELANPWTETDEQGVAEATGFEMAAPEGAADVSYSYMKETGLAQMSYVQDEIRWIYRIQKTDEITDISGMAYQWTAQEEGAVAGRVALYCTYIGTEGEETVQVVVWYDDIPSVAYSLSASGKDLDGLDIQACAEDLFVPVQGDASNDPEKEREKELEDYFLGEHQKSSDESTLTITDNSDGTFGVDINIVRLCSLEGGVGTFEDHKMTFEADDPNGNRITGVIYRDSDNSLTLEITDSTWTYLPNGEAIDGFGK